MSVMAPPDAKRGHGTGSGRSSCYLWKLIRIWLRVSRELIRERAWSRIHLVPLLLAEGDRDTYRREQAALAREKEIMKDVKGWEVRSIPPLCAPQSLMDLTTLGPLPDSSSLLTSPVRAFTTMRVTAV